MMNTGDITQIYLQYFRKGLRSGGTITSTLADIQIL